MKGARVLLEMLNKYDVDCVFGLPGETTIGWYKEWLDFATIRHILVRDVRTAAYAAEAYAKVTHKPGVCEGPSPGASYLLPGVIEAFKASVPLIVFTSDVPFNMEHRNMLTAYNQTALFEAVTKASFLVTSVKDIPFIIRRAFRLATTGRPGPVHIRIPADVFVADEEVNDLYAQRMFSRYPGHRYMADPEHIMKALTVLAQAEAPFIICGQGVHHSQAYGEVRELAERLQIPIGTTMTGKGCVSDECLWHVGVIGARGGLSITNHFIDLADVIFFIGTNTDSAGTNTWSLPKPTYEKRFIQLDISEQEVGNNYPVEVALVGDVKTTLQYMLRNLNKVGKVLRRRWTVNDVQKVKQYVTGLLENALKDYAVPINPIVIMGELCKHLTPNTIVVVDPGVGAIYSSAFLRQTFAGLWYIAGYSIGALGYGLPAAIGAWLGTNKRVILLTGDGSFGFVAGELETVARLKADVKIVVFRNNTYGWIRAEELLGQNMTDVFATDFGAVDYVVVAQGFGIRSRRINSREEVPTVIEALVRNPEPEPELIEISIRSEDELVPPVPKWVKAASERGLPYIY